MVTYTDRHARRAGRGRGQQRRRGRRGARGPPVDQLIFVHGHPDAPRASDMNTCGAPRATLARDNNSKQVNTTSDTVIANPIAPFSHQHRAGQQPARPTDPQPIQVAPTPQNGSMPVTSSAANVLSIQGTSRPVPTPALHPRAQSISRESINKFFTSRNMRDALSGTGGRLPAPRKRSNPERQVLEKTKMRQL